MISIVIPTLKHPFDVEAMRKEIINNTDMMVCELIITSLQASASVNRNKGLDEAKGSIIIQCDDDISGFFPGWLPAMINPLIFNDNVIMVSARLMKSDGISYNYMNGDGYGDNARNGEYYTVPSKIIPSSCIAIRKNDLRYDEAFVGSGYEDTDYCMRLKQIYPDGQFVIANNCQLKHMNEQKNQTGSWNEANQIYMHSKWPMGW